MAFLIVILFAAILFVIFGGKKTSSTVQSFVSNSATEMSVPVPNPETANPKELIHFIVTRDRDVLKQVYSQLIDKGIKIPINIRRLFEDKISGQFFYHQNQYWLNSIHDYQIEKENLSSYDETFRFELAGVHIGNRKKSLEECIVYEQLQLKKEPSNQYDPNAVKVMVVRRLLGYVPRDEALQVQSIMAKDHRVFIESITDINDFIDVSIIIYYKSFS